MDIMSVLVFIASLVFCGLVSLLLYWWGFRVLPSWSWERVENIFRNERSPAS